MISDSAMSQQGARMSQRRTQRDPASPDERMARTPKPGLGSVNIVQQISVSRLRTHVEHLAGEFGERNVFRPRAPTTMPAASRPCWS